jgi:hypothetical protein
MSMSGYGNYSLPATAICPGCGTMVTLPPEPLYPDSPPSICATCETEVPDYRRESYTPTAGLPTAQAPQTPTPATAHLFQGLDIENRKVSRGGLFKSLGGLLAERAEDAVENAKERFNGQS